MKKAVAILLTIAILCVMGGGLTLREMKLKVASALLTISRHIKSRVTKNLKQLYRPLIPIKLK